MITLGTVMEIEKKKALVFTMDGSVAHIKSRPGMFVGQQVTFAKKEVLAGRKKLLTVLPFAAMAAALLVVALLAGVPFGGLGLFTPQGGACAAYIALDINPSVQFRIDESGTVLSAAALNADGRTLLESLDVEGAPVKAAVERAIARARALGYIEDESGVVLVAGVLNDSNSAITGSRSVYRAKLESILGGLNGAEGADVLALYIDDGSIKDKADGNGLSLGRELLREFALQNNIGLTEEDLRSGRITDLLEQIGDPQKCMPVVTPEPTASPESTAEPTAAPTVSPAATAAPTPVPTAKPTPKPTARPTAPPVAGVNCVVSGSSLKVTWPKAGEGNGKFLYYKVVFSVNNPNPAYPDSGYAKAITNIDTLSAVVKPNSAYNGGDLGGKIKPGVTYYVSVTTCYENETVPGNAVRVKCPVPPEKTAEPEKTASPDPTAPPAFTGTVRASAGGSGLSISWDRAPTQEGFKYYKVVLSKGDSTPRYPDNGYLHAISSIDTVSCGASPGDGYSGGDVCGCLQAGQAYYVSVTYVYEGYKYYGSTVQVTMPGTPEPTCTPDACAFAGPSCSATLEGTALKVSWAKLPASAVTFGGNTYSDFQYYKVVVAGHANPKYPEDGYKSYHTNLDTHYSEVDVSEYGSGSTFYVAVTYVFTNGKLYSNDCTFTVP